MGGSAEDYKIRRATVGDVGVIARHRVAMFRDMGAGALPDEKDAEPLEAASREYLSQAMPTGLYRGWLVEQKHAIVGGGGLVVQRGVPRPENLYGHEEAYLLNVYVEPAHRRRGLARQLMDVMLTWSREHRLARIVLHASDDGRSLYESLGFSGVDTEMRLTLPRRERR